MPTKNQNNSTNKPSGIKQPPNQSETFERSERIIENNQGKNNNPKPNNRK